MSSKKVSRRDFLKLGTAVTGASAYLAACGPQGAAPAADLPDLTSGNSIPVRYRPVAAKLVMMSNAHCMKSMNWYSTTGR